MSKPAPDDLEAVRTVVGVLEGFDTKGQERILRWAQEKLGLVAPGRTPSLPSQVPITGPGQPQSLHVPTTIASDIKSFVEKKNPTSDTQFAATIAYYYRFEAPPELKKDSIGASDLQEACRKVGRGRIRFLRQTLVNAHMQGLLDRAERGAYSINTVGENLVAVALPSGGASLGKKREKKPKKSKARKARR